MCTEDPFPWLSTQPDTAFSKDEAGAQRGLETGRARLLCPAFYRVLYRFTKFRFFKNPNRSKHEGRAHGPESGSLGSTGVPLILLRQVSAPLWLSPP